MSLSDTVKTSWHRFLDVYEPLRPELYRYCRYLTRAPWDAEDLVQDALARAFATLGVLEREPENPRAWLFRVASNLWLNRVARASGPPPVVEGGHVDPRTAREAAGTLLALLSPQERAAVVLKDVFELSLDEIATVLSTSPNAIKAALHRGRGKLADDPPAEPPVVVPAVLDAFCAAFNARDLERLTKLLLDTSIVETPGLVVEYGPDAAGAGTFRGTLFGCEHSALTEQPRCEVRVHRGEPILLWWWGDAVRAVLRVWIAGDRIAELRNYFHAPELLAEVCGELALPVRTNGYRP